MRYRKVVLQALEGALGAVGYLAVDLEAYPEGRVALAVEAGVAQGAQHQRVVVPDLILNRLALL